MKIEIRKGTNPLGGRTIEFATGTSKVLLDVGCEFDGLDLPLPETEGPSDPASFDAVILASFHTDRLGAVYAQYPPDRVQVGEKSFAAMRAMDLYRGRAATPPAGFLEHGRPVRAGDLTIVPFLADCASFDTWFFEVSAGAESILYAGDFRLNGRKPFAWLLRELPGKASALIAEAPGVEESPDAVGASDTGSPPAGSGSSPRNEQEFEYALIDLFHRTTGPILALVPPLDADRLVSVHRAAKVTKRLLLEELQLAVVASAVGTPMPGPMDHDDVKTFVTRYDERGHPRNALYARFDGPRRIGRSGIAKERFVLCVRPSMLSFVRLLAKDVPMADGLLVYAMDRAYRDTPAMREFLDGCEALGLRVVTLEVRNGPDGRSLRKLADHVRSDLFLPIRSTDRGWFPNLPHGRGE